MYLVPIIIQKLIYLLKIWNDGIIREMNEIEITKFRSCFINRNFAYSSCVQSAWPNGKVSLSGGGDCGFESCRGLYFCVL